MDVLFLTFANSRDNPLPTLREEDDAVHSLLARRVAERHFIVHRDSHATLDKIAESLILYREDITVFLYSGHAGRDRLRLEDGEANALGIAGLLGRCPRLQLVILNGCSTVVQKERLLELGVPAVIGTSAPVDDRSATQFSISFFQAFCEQRESIREAFDAGFAAAQAATKEALTAEIGRGPQARGNSGQPLWGLFYKEGHEVMLDWKLPDKPYLFMAEAYEPNERLIEVLARVLAPYNQALADMAEEEEEGGEPSISDKQKAILESLPYPISEQLRKLLAPKDDNTEHVFYDKPSLDRLEQIAVTYNTIIEYLAFIMLSQLWDAASDNKNLAITPEHLAELQRFFQLKKAERGTYNFLPLIRCIRLILDGNGIPYFIPELQGLQRAFEEQSDFYHAHIFLETLKNRLPKKNIGQEEAMRLCITSEEKLAAVLEEMGFMANYTLTSVKEIGVLKYRHRKEVKFKFKQVKLVQKFVKLAEEQKIFREIMDTSSVILLKTEPEALLRYLNLSPFIIDENAFDEKAGNVSKLHFFECYERGMDTFLFRHVYKPDDDFLFVKKQKEYQVLKEQFDAFSELLFQKPMKAL